MKRTKGILTLIAVRIERRRQTQDIIGGPCWQHQSIAYGALLVPGRGAAQPSERAELCVIVCGRTRGICGFGGRVCPSHFHRPATSLRSAPFPRLLLGLCVEGAPANSSHDVSHPRTASGTTPWGNFYYRTLTSSGCIVPRTESLAQASERTNGTLRCASFAFPPAQRSAHQSLKIASNGTLRKHGLRTLCAPRACLQFDRSQMARAKEREPQGAANETSTGHQPSVNRSSTKRQRNVNRSSTKRQRNIKSGIFRREWK